MGETWIPCRPYRHHPRRPGCDDGAVVTAVVSDLHLGLGSGADLLRRERFRDAPDRRTRRRRPPGAARRRARASRPAAARGARGRGAGDRGARRGARRPRAGDRPRQPRPSPDRALARAPGARRGRGAAGARAARALRRASRSRRSPRTRGRRKVRFAYPGLWLRDDVYATHGHYLDRHLTVPTIERLGVGMVERVLGVAVTGTDPLAPPDGAAGDHDRRVRARADPRLRAALRARAGDGRRAARRRQPVGAAVADDGRRRERAAPACAAGCSARSRCRARSGSPTGSASGRCAPTSPRGRSAAPGSRRWPTWSPSSRSRPSTSIFGHTHRRGGPEAGRGRRSGTPAAGSHSPGLLGETAAVSPYWPGTMCVVADEGEPELRHLLDELSRAAADERAYRRGQPHARRSAG